MSFAWACTPCGGFILSPSRTTFFNYVACLKYVVQALNHEILIILFYLKRFFCHTAIARAPVIALLKDNFDCCTLQDLCSCHWWNYGRTLALVRMLHFIPSKFHNFWTAPYQSMLSMPSLAEAPAMAIAGESYWILYIAGPRVWSFDQSKLRLLCFSESQTLPLAPAIHLESFI